MDACGSRVGRGSRVRPSLERRPVSPVGTAHPCCQARRSPRTTDTRRMLDGLFYAVRTGCQWRHLLPPPAFPPSHRVWLHAGFFQHGHLGDHAPSSGDGIARGRRTRTQPDRRHRRHPERAKTESVGPRGYDAAKKVNGRKRHIAVAAKPKVCADTQGLLLGALVHAASIQDADSAGDLLRRIEPL